ncbi:MAG TPA: hypothetical protein VK422_02380 [Pyrinomonadaceae bacterium]|nr:hypothetical protein [Pyrinomonadaceae bacterium]
MRPTKLILGLAACALALACNSPAQTTNSAGTAAASASPVAQAAGGEVITHAGAGLRFDVPAGWKSEADGERYDLESGDGEIVVTFWVPAEAQFEDAARAIGEELSRQIEDLEFDGEPREDTHNGMGHVAITGSGKSEGKEVAFSADLLQAAKPVIVLTFGPRDAFRKHRDDYSRLVSSIKKVG